MGEAPRIAVIGAGIAGLSTAAMLSAVGIDVTVFEQASELGEVGAGVYMTSNSLRVIRALGLLDQLDEFAVRMPNRSVIYDQQGKEVGGFLPNAENRAVHRADLIDVLSRGVPKDAIVPSARLDRLAQDEHGVDLYLADGGVERFDGVVGADGIHSAVRPLVVAESTPVFSGVVAYRGLIPTERMPGWPLDYDEMYTGDGRHFLVFPVRSFSLLNFVAFVKADEEMRESWSAPGDPATLRAEFQDWPAAVQEFISKIDVTFRWGLYDREPLPRWFNGRVALAGDAAHAMLPHAGQGANQSIEDAAALGVLVRGRGSDELADAFAEYDLARRARGSFIQQYARRLGLEYDGDLRHQTRKSGQENLAEIVQVDAWIQDHDPFAAAERARLERVGAELPVGAPV